MSQVLEAPQVIEAFEKDNKLYIKTFLIDDSINLHQWAVRPEYIHKNIEKFKGVPLILTPEAYHPREFERLVGYPHEPVKNVELLRRLQEKYKIGNIIDVQKDIKQGSISHQYSAIVEITDPKAIQSFKEGKIPLYVSPSIYNLDPNAPDSALNDFEALHLAVVDLPAYGPHKANIRAQCSGTGEKCKNELKQAGETVGGCVSKTLSLINNVFSGSINSSFTTKTNTLSSNIMGEESNNQVSGQVTVTTTNPDGSKVVEQKPQEQVQKSENRAPISPPDSPLPEPKAINPPGSEEQREEAESEDVAKLRVELKAMKDELVSEINSVKEFKANLEKQTQESQALAKRTKIENVIPKDFAGSNEAREEAVSKFMNIPDAELDFVLNNFVAPTCSKNVKQAGYKAARVSDFIATKEDNSKNVKQAGTSSKDIEMLNTFLEFGGLSS